MLFGEIKTEEKDHAIILHMPMSLESAHKAKMEEISKSLIDSDIKLIILDMSQVLTLASSLYQVLVLLSKSLKERDKKLCSVGINKKLLQQINADGMKQVFQPQNSIDEAFQKSGLSLAKKVSLDSNIINPFIEATFNTLKVQANLSSIDAGKPYVKKSGAPNANIGIAAVISMICSDFNGTISLEFPTPVFLKIYESMLGEAHTAISDEIKDGASEILNMIYGQAKTILNAKGYNLQKAIPTVLVGDMLKIHHGEKSTALIVPVHTSFGDFFMEVALGNN